MTRLGLNANGMRHAPATTHYNHFHIDIRPPQIKTLPKLLEATVAADTVGAIPPVDTLADAYLQLLAQASTELGLTEENTIMFMLDYANPPDVPSMPAIVVADSRQRAGSTQSSRMILGVCHVMGNREGNKDGRQPLSLDDSLSLDAAAANYLYDYKKIKVNEQNAKITFLELPKHGKVVNEIGNVKEIFKGGNYYSYIPDLGFYGDDKVVAEVEIEGHTVRVVYFIKVRKDGNNEEKYCPKTDWWISTNDSSLLSDSVFCLAAQQQNPLLSTLLSNATSALTGFADLPGLATGQTLGSQITLDVDAAGYSWYFDPTPLDNGDDYLPTADPSIWKARPGSEAAGKMDLLSVLLHEYGHVLGLDHSADARDYMSATLRPGERRLPSAAELRHMSELIAQAKAEQNAPQPNPPANGRNEGLPANQRTPNQPQARRRPGTPLPPMGESSHAHYQAAINPTLMNGDFGPEGTAGWIAEGDIQVVGDTVTLTETPTQQTHLAQAFLIGEGDHSLRFTIGARNLAANGKGPGDAFEVALLDVNTGLPVVGAIDLTRSDVLLNLICLPRR